MYVCLYTLSGKYSHVYMYVRILSMYRGKYSNVYMYVCIYTHARTHAHTYTGCIYTNCDAPPVCRHLTPMQIDTRNRYIKSMYTYMCRHLYE